jgi:hypothetical protein
VQLSDILSQMGGLKSVASELGVSEQQAQTGAAALLPAILGGFKKQAAPQAGGLDGLGGLLGALGGGGLLDNVLAPEPTNVSQGNEVLGKIFGSKDVSRTVASKAAQSTGLDTGMLKKMLPMVAMMAAGYMAKQGGNSAPQAAAPQSGGGLGGMLGNMLGGNNAPAGGGQKAGGLAGLIDMDGDGNPLDDIMRMAGKFMK